MCQLRELNVIFYKYNLMNKKIVEIWKNIIEKMVDIVLKVS